MKSSLVLLAVSAVTFTVFGQAKENFLKQQAYAEMQRVSGQIDVIDQNMGDLSVRIGKVEGMKREIDALKAEVASLQAAVAELKSAMARQRGEIVNDLASRIQKEQREEARRQPAPAPQPVSTYRGPTKIYTVASGDNLTLIAEAFNTTVKVVQELNGLKNHNIFIGQKLRVPAK